MAVFSVAVVFDPPLRTEAGMTLRDMKLDVPSESGMTADALKEDVRQRLWHGWWVTTHRKNMGVFIKDANPPWLQVLRDSDLHGNGDQFVLVVSDGLLAIDPLFHPFLSDDQLPWPAARLHVVVHGVCHRRSSLTVPVHEG